MKPIESIAITYQPYIPRIAATLAVMCALSAFLYSAFLLEAVAQAASRTTAERQIRDISSTLGVLEGQYLMATESLTPERVAPAEVTTVVVGGSAESLSFVGR
jgi:hypothetical protein